MIKLTRLNKQPSNVNSDLMKFVEQSPDTVITLVNGEKCWCGRKRSGREQIVEFRRAVLGGDRSFYHRHSCGRFAAAEAQPAKETQ